MNSNKFSLCTIFFLGSVFLSKSQEFTAPKAEAVPTSYNIRLGEKTFLSTGVGLEFSFNDNITLAARNPKSDFIITPAVQLGIIRQFSKQFRLRLAMDFGYTKYFNYCELDHLSILPNGGNDFELSLRLADRWILRLSDTFSFSRVPVVSNTPLAFGGVTIFSNKARIALDADYNAIVLGASYTNGLALHIERKYRFLDLMSHTGEANIGVRISRPVIIGLKGGVTYLDYFTNQKNDATSFTGSLYGNFVLARNLTATASAGYQIANFDRGRGFRFEGNRVKDSSDYGNFVFTAGLAHELARNANHSITASRSMQPGYLSNYQDTWAITYNLKYSFSRFFTADFMFDYVNFETSNGPSTRSNEGETFSLTVGASFAITRHITLVGKYQYRWSDSNFADYQNNIITLGVNATF